MDEQLTPAADMAAHRRPAFPGESVDYAKARQDLLAAEIEFRRHMTRLTAQRQALPPGPLIEKDYRFKDEQGFEIGLIDLFGDKDVLVSYYWIDIKQRVAYKILSRSPVERQFAFAQERGWRNTDFIQTIGDDYARDLDLLQPDGEYPALIVYRRDGDQVRLFWMSEMGREMADPGQDPRDAPDIAALWSILDLTPQGRPADWYPKLRY
ncbi:hypothetical protein LTR94_019882 [Friedmanniomyces endolithicus]|nr:hypothetical protein LTR94_019882 [Friedmanniomyces endolithicus]